MEPVPTVPAEGAPVTAPAEAVPLVVADAPVPAADAAPADAAAAGDVPTDAVDADAGVQPVVVAAHHAPARVYPSLYDGTATTIVAIFLGIGIIAGIQFTVNRIFRGAKDEYAALTHFVVSMVALVVGAYLVDLVISGPDTSLLSASEKATILDFIKANVALVFGYYFGSRSRNSTPSTPSE
jgi:hypothetical protein